MNVYIAMGHRVGPGLGERQQRAVGDGVPVASSVDSAPAEFDVAHCASSCMHVYIAMGHGVGPGLGEQQQ